MGNTTSAVLDNIVQGSNCESGAGTRESAEPVLRTERTLTIPGQLIGKRLIGYENGL